MRLLMLLHEKVDSCSHGFCPRHQFHHLLLAIQPMGGRLVLFLGKDAIYSVRTGMGGDKPILEVHLNRMRGDP